MATTEDQKLKLANKMAQSESGQTAMPAQTQQSQPAGQNMQGYDPARWGADNPYGVDLSFWGAGYGGANNPMSTQAYWDAVSRGDTAGAEDMYNKWLYESNDPYAMGLTTEQQKQQYQLDKEAKDYEKNLGKMKDESANLLTAQADQTLNQGLHNVRSDANKRGLLYSNIREGNEAGMRGRVSSLLARQIADSNAELDQGAQSRKQTAAQAKLNQASQAMERQAQLDSIRQQNQIARAQQMQQLASIAGYAAGNYLTGATNENPNVENRRSIGGTRYYSSGVE